MGYTSPSAAISFHVVTPRSYGIGPSDGRSVRRTVLYRVNTFCPVRLLGHKVVPDAGPDISFTCEHSLSGPTSDPGLGPTYSCRLTHRQPAQSPGGLYKFHLITCALMSHVNVIMEWTEEGNY
jgi:hypothetical protein